MPGTAPLLYYKSSVGKIWRTAGQIRDFSLYISFFWFFVEKCIDKSCCHVYLRATARHCSQKERGGWYHGQRTAQSCTILKTITIFMRSVLLWRADQLLGQLLHICLLDKPVIPLYPVTLICIHICVQKYTSVYCLLLTSNVNDTKTEVQMFRYRS